MPKFCSPLLLDKAQYYSLEFLLYPILFPNKKTDTQKRVKQFFSLLLQYGILEKLVTLITGGLKHITKSQILNLVFLGKS